MLDLQYICDNLEPVAENCRNRGVEVDLDRIVALRGRRSELITSGDELRREQKATSSQIPTAESDEAKQALIARGRELREQLQGLDGELAEVEADLRSGQSRIPNMTHPDAPIALGDDGHVELRRWGDVPEFDFEPRDHVAISEAHNLIDFEAGSRVAGHGFYFLKNEAVLLELALMQLAVTRLREAGFTLMTTPDLAKDDIIEGIGFLPRGPESQIYSIENSELSLVATAEITLGGAFKDQVLEIDDLPLRCAGISHCFRTEAGAHGRATRGIYRVHQFTKVEMFGFTAPTLEASNAFHNEVVEIEEGLFQALEIPYRVVDTCTGDLGGPAYRKFDLEAWMPGRGDGGDWGEVTSASNCTDYQSRRLGIRCRTPGKKVTEFVHTLNGTAVATSRALIALLENHQQADGTIHIPEALRPWVGSDQIG